jgi:hypothetical protein
MVQKIYNFEKTEKHLMNKSACGVFKSADYWQWYTTGIENMVNNQEFFITDRLQNERSEVVSWKLYDDPNISDVILAINNDVYLWDAPFDYDMVENITNNKMEYLERVYKVHMTEDEKTYWRDKMLNKTKTLQNTLQSVVVPKYSNLQSIIRKIKDYLNDRIVK